MKPPDMKGAGDTHDLDRFGLLSEAVFTWRPITTNADGTFEPQDLGGDVPDASRVNQMYEPARQRMFGNLVVITEPDSASVMCERADETCVPWVTKSACRSILLLPLLPGIKSLSPSKKPSNMVGMPIPAMGRGL